MAIDVRDPSGYPDAVLIYVRCMEKARQRLRTVRSLAKATILADQDYLNLELAAVQFRKVLELIAFASLTANRAKYEAAHRNFREHWSATRMLEDLEKVNPGFFPEPLLPPVPSGTNSKHFDRRLRGVLTKDNFVVLYDAASGVLHMRNPYSTKDPRPA